MEHDTKITEIKCIHKTFGRESYIFACYHDHPLSTNPRHVTAKDEMEAYQYALRMFTGAWSEDLSRI
ncbi:hypothetical protein UFOVP1288_4 [uncultured Caudovirales phage]|uniref:Uncharacterized protein n=1 Tax=uncultured Caudovirales phage TaxID=2100421 RepID=A0A6J5S7M8_9CAUD|nr:hypothetical protein UFOVP1195_4 [uncultured Caudovirales phage]CAB4195274.1 hypothetical protein UFOVP1288_4 [uncultured Caudovirales phage]CAB4204904.1 hypothetical protein UFOVP1409_4 [uncultured Caudovirales phage]